MVDVIIWLLGIQIFLEGGRYQNCVDIAWKFCVIDVFDFNVFVIITRVRAWPINIEGKYIFKLVSSKCSWILFWIDDKINVEQSNILVWRWQCRTVEERIP